MLPELDLTALKSINMEVLNEFISEDKKKEGYSGGGGSMRMGILLELKNLSVIN